MSPVFTRGSYARLDSQLAFGTYQGVSIFDPEKIKASEEIAPKVILGSIDLNRNPNKKFNPGEEAGVVELAHNENSLNFNFYSTYPGFNSSIEYSWRLEGYEEEWSLASNQERVSYANLGPGNYTFLVRARKPGGKWSEVEEASFEIGSPWWMSPIAYVLAGIILLALCFILIRVFRKNRRRSQKTKTSYVQNLNQEMGTSLTVLLASLDSIAEEEDVKNKSRLQSIIYRLQELLEPILSSKSAGIVKGHPPKIAKINLQEYIKDLTKDLDPLLKQKGLEIYVNDQWSNGYFYNDKFFLNKIFLTIISNSITYSFDGGKIIINLIQTNRGDLKVQIADNGLGLPQEDQKIIRDYFENAKNTLVKGHSQQLNLLYVKDFISKIGGSIVFESSKDQGTTFTIILKNHQLAETSEPGPEKRSIQEESPEQVAPVKQVEQVIHEALPQPMDNLGVKVLIAEDNDELRKIFIESFKRLGEVFEAKRGMEAYQIATTIKPAIIIADFEMPGMNGLSLFKALNKEGVIGNSAFYLMVTPAERNKLPGDIAEQGLSLISKPLNINALFQVILDDLQQAQSRPHQNPRLSERNSMILKGSLDTEFGGRLEKIILQNIQNPAFNIEDLSAAMGLSPASLHFKIQNSERISPQDFVMRTRLKYARSLIIDGNSDLADVARKAGFANKDIFFTSYKKHFGVMPGTIIDRF
ncbi:ATP-binding protein [Antarcticibacterium sp. 1MA-6-2]|uniref:triple tyrosine motif-containing protein n=1 Tax=Antarcticibacterium sp. 1MA-6-2 TaxID=2908210 RepID=UPI001F47C074|nr:triple tyrosine motif-containing protein [Antarcticibacterium sp. 1MA-6-2]UJH91019.1 ATP-binding protein [Antarcticibacterium sp. 1MA-6-2]